MAEVFIPATSHSRLPGRLQVRRKSCLKIRLKTAGIPAKLPINAFGNFRILLFVLAFL